MKMIIGLLFISTMIPAQKLILSQSIGNFKEASAFSIVSTGHIYVSDRLTNEIYKLDTLGTVLKTIGGYGWSEAAFDDPSDIYSTILNTYVADKNNDRIQIFDKDLNFLSEFNSNNFEGNDEQFSFPTGCVVSPQGDLFILDSDNSRVLKYNLNGKFLLEIGNFNQGKFVLNEPYRITISSDNKLFVSDGDKILVFDQFGTGIFQLATDITSANVNITNHILTINNDEKIKLLDLSNPQKSFNEFSGIPDSESRIVEAAVFNNKLYVLTEKNILVYQFQE